MPVQNNASRIALLLAFASLGGHAFAQCDGNLFEVAPADQSDPEEFGESVGISGAVMIVGSSDADGIVPDTGAAYLYDTATGLQIAKLFASDGVAQHGFGESVAIDGPLAVVGAENDSAGGSNSGAAYVFDVTTGNQLFKLVPSDGQSGDTFGQAVAIHGTSILVGTWGADKAYIFDATTGAQLHILQPGAGVDQAFGYAVALEGTTAIIGAPEAGNSQTGAAFLFDVTNGNFLGTLVPVNPPAGAHLASTVDVHGSIAILGGVYTSGFIKEAYLFDIPSLTETFVLRSPTPSPDDEFAGSVALADGRAIVSNSSRNWQDNGDILPTVHLFDTATGLQLEQYEGVAPVFGAGFGHVVAMDGDKVLVGAPTTVLFVAPPGGEGAAHLIDITMDPVGASYCSANANSTGQPATIEACGSPSIAVNDFRLMVSSIPNTPYLFFHGAQQSSMPLGNGLLCATGGVQRLGPARLATTQSGARTVDLPTEIATPGTRHFQCWFRDPVAGGAQFNLSNALTVTFVP